MSSAVKVLTGFALLFVLYHGAEYFVLHTYQPIVFLLLQACFLASAILIARTQGFRGLGAWGLDRQQGWIKLFLVGMLLGAILYGATFAISVSIGSEEVSSVPTFREAAPNLLQFACGLFLSSLSEDILTRGYIYKHLQHRVSSTTIILICSIVYVLNHVYRLADGWETWLYLFLLGILFAIPLILTTRLWITVGIHWMGNLVFYFTHNIITTSDRETFVSPNIILLGVTIVLSPVVAHLAKALSRSGLNER